LIRRALHLLAFLPPLLFAVLLALWIRSHWCWDVVSYDNRSANNPHSSPFYCSLTSGLGLLMFDSVKVPSRNSWLEIMFSDTSDIHHGFDFATFPLTNNPRPDWIGNDTLWGQLGFHVSYRKYPGYEMRRASMPQWPLCVAAIIPPAFSFLRALRINRRKFSGLCPHCGYDVRATPERCPECGNTVVKLEPLKESRLTMGIVYPIIVGLVVVIGVAQEVESHLAVDRIANWKTNQERLRREESQAFELVGAFFRTHLPKGKLPSREAAVELAKSGSWASPQPAASDPLFEDPKSHALVRLRILGSAWAAYEVLPRTVAEPRMWVATARHGVMVLAYFAWWVLVFRLSHLAPPQRKAVGHVIVGLAFFCLICGLMTDPTPTPGSA
jgi:hypothetical protein